MSAELKNLLLVTWLISAFAPQATADWNNLKLHYDEPAAAWTDALPVGNGSTGAMVFGGVQQERIQFNHETLWVGQPRSYSRPGASKHLAEIRRLLFDNRQNDAQALAMEQFMSQPLRQTAYQPFGDVILEFPELGIIDAYSRELDLDGAVATTMFQVEGVSYKRTVLASHPDGVIAIRIEADQPGHITFTAKLSTLHEKSPSIERFDDTTLRMTGVVDDFHDKKGASFDGKVAFEARLQVDASGGSANVTEDGIQISGADSATLYLAAATSYENYQSLAADPAKQCRSLLQGINGKPYTQILADHQTDHRELFRRVKLDLGGGHSRSLATNKRLSSHHANPDLDFVALLYQYGRYLLIASSRPGGQAANLQGIWNASKHPSWDSKYTLNINAEMNYWLAELTNLSECHEPLFDMIDELAVTGTEIAQDFYDADGWVVHHNTDAWRGAAPINHANHGIWPMGGAWLCSHLWQRYVYSGDEQFLSERAYPRMKGASEFFLDYLVEDPVFGKGWLVSGPSNSPEHGGLVMAPTMDHQIIRNLLVSTAEAAEVLNQDADFSKKLRETAERIAPNQVGSKGQLKEWLYKENPDTDHRHVSHLWGLFPGSDITTETPDTFQACKKTLEFRGDKGTGWSRAWKVNFWARLHDGEHMNKILLGFFNNTSEKGGAGFYNNLFDAHPPFQIDGNFGLTAGISEALMQSHRRDSAGNYIVELLPALPPTWRNGSIDGLRCRGGFDVSISWKDEKLEYADFKSRLGNPLSIRNNDGKILKTETKKGNSYRYTGDTIVERGTARQM